MRCESASGFASRYGRSWRRRRSICSCFRRRSAGPSLALQLATGISIRFWVLPIAFLIWLMLWLATFSSIEHGVAFLGLVTLSFVLAAVWLRPDWHEVAVSSRTAR